MVCEEGAEVSVNGRKVAKGEAEAPREGLIHGLMFPHGGRCVWVCGHIEKQRRYGKDIIVIRGTIRRCICLYMMPSLSTYSKGTEDSGHCRKQHYVSEITILRTHWQQSTDAGL